MLKCIDYEDTLFKEPRVFLIHGLSGKGCVISPTNISVIKDIDISFPSMQTWFEDGCIKLFSMNGEFIYEIERHIPWNLIEGWCKAGAHIDFWYN
jgi:hypothetical protein